jgi:lipopolysaccharide transport system permease protein
MFEGFRFFRLWMWMAENDIKSRYRGSIFGPYWIVLNLVLLISFLGIIYSSVFKLDIDIYLPYVAMGFVIWYLITGIITESSRCLIDNAGLIKNFNYPISIYILRLAAKNIILFAHNAIVMLFVILLFDVNLGWKSIYFFVGFLITIFNLSVIGFIISIISARFRDVPHAIDNLMQLALFITPVLFYKDMLGSTRFIVDFNPFFHMINVMRTPLLNNYFPFVSFLFLIGFFFILLFIARRMHILFSKHIAYWV